MALPCYGLSPKFFITPGPLVPFRVLCGSSPLIQHHHEHDGDPRPFAFSIVLLIHPCITPNLTKISPSCGKRLSRYFLDASMMQAQDTVATARKGEIVSRNERGELIVAM